MCGKTNENFFPDILWNLFTLNLIPSGKNFPFCSWEPGLVGQFPHGGEWFSYATIGVLPIPRSGAIREDRWRRSQGRRSRQRSRNEESPRG